MNVFVSCEHTHCRLCVCVCVCVSKESTLWRQTCSLLYEPGISWSTGGRVVDWSHTQVCVFVCALVFGRGRTQEVLWSLLQTRSVHRNTRMLFLWHLCSQETVKQFGRRMFCRVLGLFVWDVPQKQLYLKVQRRIWLCVCAGLVWPSLFIIKQKSQPLFTQHYVDGNSGEVSTEHFWSFSVKQCCSVLLNNWSRWRRKSFTNETSGICCLDKRHTDVLLMN